MCTKKNVHSGLKSVMNIQHGAGVHNQLGARGLNYKKEEPQHANCVSRLSTGAGDRT